MPSKEHLALKFDICTILQSAKPDETVKTAGLILSTIRAALQEPTEGMLAAANEEDWDADYDITFSDCWRAMLAASALGEQSE
ncbi:MULTISPECIES: hypothetical protein [Pseudomonadota]|uniref:hypothetical protein n=1 Tax=Pseudomonadota TaxID=1224 RepID=UPI000DE53B5C|nr:MULTISPECIES: hypothetical protein [Pseudomonadota]MDQ4679415.1 hypothetical protein [Stenotrophomonas maltophilia group sp. RNC7]MPR61289.1 hypothetical protein [Brucella intermedia]MPR62719.1 hypothetical protein [Brucella intermedia]